MKPQRRTQADRSGVTRERLVAVARDLFAERGYAAVGTEAIVRAAGVTRGALYHQFADKADLFAAVVEAVEVDVTARIDAVVSSSGETDPITLMRLGAEAWLTASGEPEATRILLRDAPAVLGADRWREIGLRHGIGLVQSLLTYAVSAGRIPEQPIQPLAHVLVGALNEAALWVAGEPDPGAARAQALRVLRRLIDSLAAGG